MVFRVVPLVGSSQANRGKPMSANLGCPLDSVQTVGVAVGVFEVRLNCDELTPLACGARGRCFRGAGPGGNTREKMCRIVLHLSFFLMQGIQHEHTLYVLAHAARAAPFPSQVPAMMTCIHS